MNTALALFMVALALLASTAYAETEPIELTEVDPPDGARIDAPLEVLGEGGPSALSRSPAHGVDAETEDGEDGPDILLMALITIASAGGAALLFTLGYLLRRRIGFEPHRPPPSDEDEGGEH